MTEPSLDKLLSLSHKINGFLAQKLQEEHWKLIKRLELQDLIAEESEHGAIEDIAGLCTEMTSFLALSPDQDVVDRIKNDLVPVLSSLYYVTLAILLIEHEQVEATLRNALLQRLLPLFGQFWTIASHYRNDIFAPEGDNDWIEVTWDFVEATEDINLSVPVLARMLKIFFPWKDAETVDDRLFESTGFDIRRVRGFELLIKSGLLHGDSSTRKQALYILKHTITFCTYYMQHPTEADNNKLFVWPATQRPLWSILWKKFFLLYESVHETQVHIVEPLLPQISALAQDSVHGEPALPIDWWAIIPKKAFKADSIDVRKRVIQTVLDIDISSEQFARLREEKQFLLESLMHAIDSASLYTNPDAPVHVSPFGWKVATFYSSLLNSDAVKICEFLMSVMDAIRSATPALFLLQSLMLADPQSVIRREELLIMKRFARNKVVFHNIKARRLVKWQLLQILTRHIDPAAVGFDDISSALGEFLAENSGNLRVTSKDFQGVSRWLDEAFGENYIADNIALAVSQYFSLASAGSEGIDVVSAGELKQTATDLASILVFTLDKEGGFAQFVRPLYQEMSRLSSEKPNFVLASITLFTSINSAIQRVSDNKIDLLSNIEVGERLFEWIAILNDILLNQSTKMPDMESIEILLSGMNVFLTKGIERRDQLIKYLDILLYKMVDLLSVFQQHKEQELAENYEFQLQKSNIISLMDMGLHHLEHVNSFHVGFMGAVTVQRILGCELEKPPALTDSQAADWSSLISSFAISKWNLIATMARFSRRSADLHPIVDLPSVYRCCTDALETARHQAVLGIFKCQKVLVSLPPFERADSEASLDSKYSDTLHDLGDFGETGITIDDLVDNFKVAKNIFDETENAPTWYYLYVESFIDYAFQPALFSSSALYSAENSFLAQVFEYYLKVGSRRKNVLTRLSQNLYTIWSTNKASLKALRPLFIQLLLFGPNRDDLEDRMAHALTISNHTNDTKDAKREVVDALELGSDYVVRANMNSLLLHLDPMAGDDKHFALAVMDDLLDEVCNE